MRVTRLCSAVFLIALCRSCAPVCHACFVMFYEDSFAPSEHGDTSECHCPMCKHTSDWMLPAVVDQMSNFWARSSAGLQHSNHTNVPIDANVLPAVLTLESGRVSLDASLFFEWCNQDKDPDLSLVRDKVNNMPMRLRLYWSRYFDYIYSSTPPSSLQLFTGTHETMRVCPNQLCGLSFRHESPSSGSSDSAVAFVCHSDCTCDHTLDGPCELCHLPFQNHHQQKDSGRKCADGSSGRWRHQVDMRTECPYCAFAFCEHCFLPWNFLSVDGSKQKCHAGVLCLTYKGVIESEGDDNCFLQKQDAERMSRKNAAAEKALLAAAEEKRVLAQSGTKDCPRCGYGPLVHDRGHHCHHIVCTACSYEFCYCCLGPYNADPRCQCPVFCDARCDCAPCTTCKFHAPCQLCDDGFITSSAGKSPYARFPAQSVAAFEEKRQKEHEAAVQQHKELHPTWPGMRRVV